MGGAVFPLLLYSKRPDSLGSAEFQETVGPQIRNNFGNCHNLKYFFASLLL